MKEFLPKLKNFWFYHKFHLLIAVAALAVVIYSFLPGGEPDADYHVSIVSALPCTEERLDEIEAHIVAAGRDVNGDGEIVVTLHSFAVDLANTDPHAGYMNYEKVAALDADLVGRVSLLYLFEAAEAFREAAGGVMQEPYMPFDEQFTMALRNYPGTEYVELFEALK